MRLTHFFIDRPRFATVLSVFVTSLGLGALAILPVAQYPEIVPPTVKVTTSYPGASAETVARTVATPLEQEINGVENMLYMNSQSTGDGNLTITVTFAIGTDLNIAQMLTQKPGAGRTNPPAGGRPAPGRAGPQGDTQHPIRHSPLLAGRVARHALPVELRDPAHQGRVGAPAGRRRRAIPGRSRICDAHLARPGQGGGLRSHRQRRALRAARAKSSGLGRYLEPAADPE